MSGFFGADLYRCKVYHVVARVVRHGQGVQPGVQGAEILGQDRLVSYHSYH